MKLDYEKAKKLGEREYRRRLVKGQYPYLPSLDEMVSEIGRMPEISLGTAEIPMDMIVGTRTSGRKNAFAANFMPLMGIETEFAAKWSRLYDSQVEEGIRDPIKVYEFMNRFYVEEGNKRVSVMKFVGAVTIPANVIRIRPPRTDSEQSRLYYEYLDFYKVTKSFEIVFSAPGRYEQLARILEQNLQDPWPAELLEKLHVGLTVFKEIYYAKGGRKLNITIGDALLIYLSVYSLDSLLREGNDVIGRRLLRLWREYIAASQPEGIALIERREDAETVKKKSPLAKVADLVGRTNAAGVTGAAEIAGAVAGIRKGADAAHETKDAVKTSLESVIPVASVPGHYSPAHPLKIAFIHEKSAASSGWVYGHMLGMNHLKLNTASLSMMPFLVIRMAVPSHISPSSERLTISVFLLPGRISMKSSPSERAMMKNSPSLPLAIMGELTSLSFSAFSLHIFAFTFKALAEATISVSEVFSPFSKTLRLSACSFVTGMPRNFITIRKQTSPLSCCFSI